MIRDYERKTDMAPVPLSIFRSNSKFDENSERSSFIVVIGRVYFTQECFEFSSNSEFDRNMRSGTGAWPTAVAMIYMLIHIE